MSYYERRLQRDLEELRQRIAQIGEDVEAAVRAAVRAALSGDRELANATALGDLAINRETRAIDRACHAFVARHLPIAGHLRFISSTLRLTVALERIGDHAVTISREALLLSAPPPEDLCADIERMSEQALGMLHQAMQAWNSQSAELARGTKIIAEQVEQTQAGALDDLLKRQGEALGILDTLALFVILGSLERVSDLAKNICEETIFTLTGQTKPPKIYKVFFADSDGLTSALACAIARRTHPGSGRYDAGGLSPAAGYPEHLARWAGERGLELPEGGPRRVHPEPHTLASQHVVVRLGPEAREALHRQPFHTIYLGWDPPALPAPELDEQAAWEQLDTLYRELSGAISALMVQLRGEEAS